MNQIANNNGFMNEFNKYMLHREAKQKENSRSIFIDCNIHNLDLFKHSYKTLIEIIEL